MCVVVVLVAVCVGIHFIFVENNKKDKKKQTLKVEKQNTLAGGGAKS